MKRIAFFLYGVTAYLLFVAVYTWLTAFVGNLWVGRSIDAPVTDAVPQATVIDMGLIVLFGLQHSVMARPAFKRRWTRVVPQPIERSTYVVFSCALVALLIWQWRPIGPALWDVRQPIARGFLYGLFAAGWLLVPAASMMIDHFDLLGTRQVWVHLRGQEYELLTFRTPWFYSRVRHPLYVGWFIAFWAAPTMTAGHLLFASALTAYILIAVAFEERDLVAHFGHDYVDYQARVPRFFPWPRPPKTSPIDRSPIDRTPPNADNASSDCHAGVPLE